jgi:isoquinoline 1-oxidoreductase subunit beta
MGKWTRRAFITAGSLVGGGVVLGVGGIAFAPNRFAMVPEQDQENETSVTTWIKITPDNEIIAIIPHCEMGQGVQTGIAMMLAEELEADWNHVSIEEAPAENLYANGHLIAGFAAEAMEIPPWLERALQYASYKISDIAGLQMTGGSASTYTTGKHGMRIAGAAAKEMLIQAAAQQWGVPASECKARQSMVVHSGSNRSSSYGELANAAALIKPPVHPVLKSRNEYTLVGTQINRPDIPAKVNGATKYGIDTELPGMLYAAINAAPVNGGVLVSVDHASVNAAMDMPGVQKIVELENAVVVVAEGYWQASQALKTLKADFSLPENYSETTEVLYQQHANIFSEDGSRDLLEGEGAAALENADNVLEMEYRVPYLAHAAMEPMSATARFSEGHCELWAGTQDPLSARGVAAKALELDAENVTLHNSHVGGGFGRRLPGCFDYIEQAAQIARQMSPTPVKLIWSREEDMKHDYYRVATLARFRGALDASGNTDVWCCDYTAPGEMGASHPIYAIPNKEIHTYDTPGHLRVGYWRSVAYSQQGFFMESFADELAVAAGQDPYEYRMTMLNDKPRHQKVLAKVASMANWGKPTAQNRALGIAIVEAFNSIIAEVAEVSVDENNNITIHNMYAAVDCGLVVNPDQAVAQIQGGMLFGISSALHHEITLKGGIVEQNSFPDYPMLQMHEAPRVHVEFLESDASMGGLGEPGVPPVAPAIGNAIFAATGKRIRELPFAKTINRYS